MANTPTVECAKESDGFHVHVYTVTEGTRRIRIEHHQHAWMDDHMARYPHLKAVDAHESPHRHLGYWDTVEQAWEALGVAGEIPTVTCRA